MTPEEKVAQEKRIHASLDKVVAAYEKFKNPKHCGRPRTNEKDLRKFVYRAESVV